MPDCRTKTEQFDNRWLGIKDAAEYCGISTNKMRELFYRQDFPGHKIGVRPVVKQDELDKYIKEGKAAKPR